MNMDNSREGGAIIDTLTSSTVTDDRRRANHAGRHPGVSSREAGYHNIQTLNRSRPKPSARIRRDVRPTSSCSTCSCPGVSGFDILEGHARLTKTCASRPGHHPHRRQRRRNQARRPSTSAPPTSSPNPSTRANSPCAQATPSPSRPTATGSPTTTASPGCPTGAPSSTSCATPCAIHQPGGKLLGVARRPRPLQAHQRHPWLRRRRRHPQGRRAAPRRKPCKQLREILRCEECDRPSPTSPASAATNSPSCIPGPALHANSPCVCRRAHRQRTHDGPVPRSAGTNSSSPPASASP
jgi:hypothetical protein